MKRIAKLSGEPELPKPNKQAKQDAKARVGEILKKREQKLAEKKQVAKPHLTEEDQTLIRQRKNQKKEKRREQAKTEKDFD